MKRLLILFTLLIIASCAKQSKPSYIVQVSLGGWNAPEYQAVLGLSDGNVVAHKKALAVIAFVAVAAGSKHCGRCCDG